MVAQVSTFDYGTWRLLLDCLVVLPVGTSVRQLIAV